MLLLFIIDIIIAAGAASLDLFHHASCWITLTVSEVVDTENQIKPSLPSLIDRPNFTSALFPGDEWTLLVLFFFFSVSEGVPYSAGNTAGFSDVAQEDFKVGCPSWHHQ